MSDIVDLSVHSITEEIYRLQARVEKEPVADDVSRRDWYSAVAAAWDLLMAVRVKIGVSPEDAA